MAALVVADVSIFIRQDAETLLYKQCDISSPEPRVHLAASLRYVESVRSQAYGITKPLSKSQMNDRDKGALTMLAFLMGFCVLSYFWGRNARHKGCCGGDYVTPSEPWPHATHPEPARTPEFLEAQRLRNLETELYWHRKLKKEWPQHYTPGRQRRHEELEAMKSKGEF